ncbi:hypothetical protein BFJ66_g17009 [Fusarium oxysporum f. sp. cepae]|uniref:BTB domain-containing protein n=1 Tax=Fusarium oxysporum f. sp. cepae TaxID=396571 RepID=A0A3L6N293_FUSOX|nr:hypothetical protein BFJ65_g14695 [Fusarium oxysporum f. sp. cepae]RKK23993.1 hypothetical protein BFJ67_g16861 [Fusarium oxysporum f. sp. cepae]RKK26679.1 hypothetical protein BFJ66_g17009 [Fusarium oxysporum f. sp. cepae]
MHLYEFPAECAWFDIDGACVSSDPGLVSFQPPRCYVLSINGLALLKQDDRLRAVLSDHPRYLITRPVGALYKLCQFKTTSYKIMVTTDEYLHILRENLTLDRDFVTFRIGPNRHEFCVHKSLVTMSSPVFKAGLEGCWTESGNNEYQLRDTDPETFRCVIGFLYTGNYTQHVDLGTADHGSSYNDPEVEAGIEETPNASAGPVSSRPTTPGYSLQFPYSVDQFIISLSNFEAASDPTHKLKLSNLQKIGRTLASFKRLWPENNYLIDSTWIPETDSDMEHYYRPNLLLNAKVYVFAERYNMEPLKQASLYYTKQLLCHFIPRKEHIGALIDIVHEIYEGTQENDCARKLISSYFGCFLEHLMEPEIAELYSSRHDFLHDTRSFLECRRGDN